MSVVGVLRVTANLGLWAGLPPSDKQKPTTDNRLLTTAMAETLVTANTMKDPATGRYQISKDVIAARITPYIEEASERLREWVGDAAYDDALDTPSLSALSASEQRFITRRRKVLATIEGDLTMSYLIINLNTIVTPRGLITEAREEGQTVVRYLSPAQVREQAAIWFDQAQMMASRYLVNGNVPAAQIEFAEVSNG